MQYRHVALLSVGHLATDINQGALPAILPFFITAFDLSYASAAGIVFAANMTSSIVQPLFGHAADRFSKPWLLLAGLLTAGVGLALTGICNSYHWTLFLAIISGIGIAAYHPEAARLVNFAAGENKATAMSLFGIGGTIGFSLGPMIVTVALIQWGLSGTLILIMPVSFVALVLASQYAAFESLAAGVDRRQRAALNEDSKDNWGAFSGLTVVIIGRSIIFYGLNTFIPIYWIHALNQSKAAGAMALSIFAGSGILGNLLGGHLADRIGEKNVMVLGFFGLALFLPMLIFAQQMQIATLLLIPIGLTLYGTYSPAIILGQRYLPNRVGLSSGVTLGVAVAIGGGAAPIIGKIADIYGIWYAMLSIACLPIPFMAIGLRLPKPESTAS